MIQDADPGDLPGSDLDDNSGRQPGQTPRKPEASHFRTEEPEFVAHYNEVRLHSAIGYVTPADRLAGRETAIWSERKRKLAAAEARRRTARTESAAASGP